MSKIIQASDEDGKIYLKPYFPIGYIYISMNEIDLNAIYGGTWEQIKDVFLLAAGDTYSAGSTGGEATHTLTSSEMPKHTHYLVCNSASTNHDFTNYGTSYQMASASWQSDSTKDYYVALTSGSASYVKSGSTGSGGSHNNMPPYLAVYMYQKIAN